MKRLQSAERVSEVDASDNYVFQRSILAYHKAAEMVSGDVLEIGTGNGYGISVVSPKAKTFITIDKHNLEIDISEYHNVEFDRMKVPPLDYFESGSFDFVITFQVIEHIRNDFGLLKEIYRVLRPDGKLIITTPNKKMSLTRNPWHVREYTPDEFYNLLSGYFMKIKAMGVFGKENVMEYYELNKQSVAKITKYDIFGFNKWLPRWLLRIPYDIFNRINRKKLLEENRNLTSHITMKDYYLDNVADNCFDLFYIAKK